MISNKETVIKAAHPFVSPYGIGAAGREARNDAHGPARPADPGRFMQDVTGAGNATGSGTGEKTGRVSPVGPFYG
jgi:hypothetical protein